MFDEASREIVKTNVKMDSEFAKIIDLEAAIQSQYQQVKFEFVNNTRFDFKNEELT